MRLKIKLNQDRHRGCLLGLATADAVGTTNEFYPPGSFEPITDMVGGGPFGLKVGEWTDDTSMALCIASSLLDRGFNLSDQARRYAQWWQNGFMSHNGRCFDIGGTCSSGIRAFLNGTPAELAGSEEQFSISNGSMMRLAPVPMRYAYCPEKAISLSILSSQPTHRHEVVLDAVRLHATCIIRALNGASKEEILQTTACRTTEMQSVGQGAYKRLEPPFIKGTGFAPKSLEAALWCFYKSSSFEEGALLAANLGDDADTTGAIYGQVAGAFYGYSGIPKRWLDVLAWHDKILYMADGLFELCKKDADKGNGK